MGVPPITTYQRKFPMRIERTGDDVKVYLTSERAAQNIGASMRADITFNKTNTVDRDAAYALIAALSDLLDFNCRATIMDQRAKDDYDKNYKWRVTRKGY